MNKLLYPMIFKRKSFHIFSGVGNESITSEELEDLKEAFKRFQPLIEGIKVELHISKNVFGKVGQEYNLMLYSEVKEGYLQNIGYLGEQLDLYCVSKHIGTLWFGLGNAKEKEVNGLKYCIMIAIAKVSDDSKYREDIHQGKRKALEDIWQGNYFKEIGDLCRYAPSAINSQPWFVKASQNELLVYRTKGLPMVSRFNQIDIGIFICYLDLCLEHEGIKYEKEICVEGKDRLNARYKISE